MEFYCAKCGKRESVATRKPRCGCGGLWKLDFTPPKFDLAALQANSHDIGRRIHDARRNQLDRVGPDDPDSPVRVLAELDILNSYERIRSCYINMAETLAGRK